MPCCAPLSHAATACWGRWQAYRAFSGVELRKGRRYNDPKWRCRVGRAVTRSRPLARSGRADFPHTALPPRCLAATFRTTTSWSPGDMSHNVKALHLGPSRSSPRHGPPGRGRIQRLPVPRRHRSYAALRLPASVGHGSGSPCRRPPSWRTLVLCPQGRRHVRPLTCRASETGHRLSAKPACRRGEARASQVTGPSASDVLWSNTPPDTGVDVQLVLKVTISTLCKINHL
jgi:hypothetical protein